MTSVSSTASPVAAVLRLAGIMALLAIAACGNPTVPDRGAPGILVVSGAGEADSVTAILPQPLTVELRDSVGALRRGVPLQFTTPAEEGAPGLVFAPVGAADFQQSVTVATDSAGRAQVRVALGRVAGTATVTITGLGFTQTAAYTVRPGAATSLAVAPADSAVTVGGTYSLRIVAPDRFGNPTSPAFTPEHSVVSSSGGSVRGERVGRTSVLVQAGSHSAVIRTSVVPQGTLLAARGDGIYMFNLDGSAVRRVVTSYGLRSPRWFPNGQSFVFSAGLSRAYVSDLNGNYRHLVQGTSSLEEELWAHPSRDGAWVFFGGYSGWEFRGYPYRVRADGTELGLVPGFAPNDETQGHPSPSPDGTRIAYFREAPNNSRAVTIRVLNMITGTVTLDVPGHSPEWSHGDSIAFLAVAGRSSGPLKLMASDGTGERTIADAPYDFGIDWSPDDRWIAARNSSTNRIEIVEVATGMRVPLPYSAGLSDPSWKP
jgi:hypothetical protein